MIEVFKTNVKRVSQARQLIALLLEYFPDTKINFDLDDCDKVLRVEGETFIVAKVTAIVKENGFQCQVLD